MHTIRNYQRFKKNPKNAMDRDCIMLRGHMRAKEIRSNWSRSGKSPFIEVHHIEGNGGRLNFL